MFDKNQDLIIQGLKRCYIVYINGRRADKLNISIYVKI